MASDINIENKSFKDCSRKIKVLSILIALLPRGRGAVPRAIGKLFRSQFTNTYVLTRHGVKMVVTPEALDCFTTMANSNWAFDYWVFDTCAVLMPEGGTFYDIGANVGYISLEMSQLKSDGRRVVSFEPQGALVKNLRLSCKLSGIENIDVLKTCVGEVSREVYFTLERHSIHAHVDYSEKPTNYRATEVAQMVALDDLVRGGDLPVPDVIKIDVEGYEFNVLQGAKSVIEMYQPHIVFELSEATPKFGWCASDFFDLLSTIGNYTFEYAIGSYRDPQIINDLDAFDREFSKNPRLTNILARSSSRPH